jgi:quercetin dioxygenase-like cupin family protein
MKPITTTFVLMLCACLAHAQGGKSMQTITITRSGSQASSPGQAEYFTGSVRVDPLFPVTEPARASAARVTFEPGARTAWHTHPLGQKLIVTAGTGWVQEQGGPVQEIREGDVVLIPRCQALARRYSHHAGDAHRHSRAARGESRGVDGEGERSAIPAIVSDGPVKRKGEQHARNSSIRAG